MGVGGSALVEQVNGRFVAFTVDSEEVAAQR